jgi:hypothetical protein
METLESMRALLRANRPRTWNLGYPLAVRERISGYITARRAGGDTPTAIARELGLSRQSVVGWTLDGSVPASFVPVEVVPEAADPSPGPPHLIFVSPRGYRVEGLDVAAIGALLERLG